MAERSWPLYESCVRVVVWFLAAVRGWKEGARLDDPRVAAVRSDAAVWVSEGMTPWEAVALAGDLAFRRFGLPRR
jgi:hypothetical protein